jgi:hypothetical protein
MKVLVLIVAFLFCGCAVDDPMPDQKAELKLQRYASEHDLFWSVRYVRRSWCAGLQQEYPWWKEVECGTEEMPVVDRVIEDWEKYLRRR